MALLLEEKGNIIVERECGPHIIMLLKKYHDLNEARMALSAAFQRDRHPQRLLIWLDRFQVLTRLYVLEFLHNS